MAAKRAEKGRRRTQLGKLENDLKRLTKLRGEVIPQSEYDAKGAEVETQLAMQAKGGPMQRAIFQSIPIAIGLILGAWVEQANAQAKLQLRDVNVQNQANNVLTLMTFTLLPDVTTSTLSISSAATGDPGLTMVQVGGGATISRDHPVYLEGTLGYSRYDPKFVVSDGATQMTLPLRWNNLSVTGGIGWDFALTNELFLRPILNISLGEIASDLKIAEVVIERVQDREINFLKNGAMTAYGYGGSLMLDWERVRPNYEFDLETRYSHIRLQTYGNTDSSMKGSSEAKSANVWTRYRAPTGLTALNRPVRYVLEAAHTQFLGAQQGALGFDHLTSVGLGLELDTSAHEIFVSRIRLVARRIYGQNAAGASLGLAASF